jgi:hypothetical protein
LYTRYFIKFPILVFIVIIIGFLVLFYLISSTNTDVFKTFDGTVVKASDGSFHIETVIGSPAGLNITDKSRAFWYKSKQETVNTISYITVQTTGTEMKIELYPAAESVTEMNGLEGSTVSVDIAVYNQTLFDRVLHKGAKPVASP